MEDSKRDEILIRLDEHVIAIREKLVEIQAVTLMHARRLIEIDKAQASHSTHIKWIERAVTGTIGVIGSAIAAYFYKRP